MAIKELKKHVKNESVLGSTVTSKMEKEVEKFISKGGTLSKSEEKSTIDKDDHRLTLRIPKFLMDKVDVKRKKRVGSISRNLWILEIIEQATKDEL